MAWILFHVGCVTFAEQFAGGTCLGPLGSKPVWRVRFLTPWQYLQGIELGLGVVIAYPVTRFSVLGLCEVEDHRSFMPERCSGLVGWASFGGLTGDAGRTRRVRGVAALRPETRVGNSKVASGYGDLIFMW